MDLSGVAIITGAAATALQFAKEDCKRIVIADINNEALQETRKLTESISKDVSVTVVQLDVRDEKSVKNLIDVAISTYGRIDYCANVAGIIKFGDTTVLPTEDFELVYEINLRGVFLCAKYQISAMLEQEPLASKHSQFPARGSIINVASQAGLMGNPNLPAYVASKHGVIGLSKSDGLKFGAQGIRVNALCPGTIQTPILGDLPQGKAGEERQAQRMREIALKRVGEPEEVAQCVAFLASGRSSFITATTLAVHGGLQ
ncbi:hypothetical protein KCU68_g17370, partial [Aureobasidium melanogenum]